MPFLADSLYYETKGERGDRPTIVFAHGAGGNAAIWFNQIAYFSENHQVIAFDHRLFGRSDAPASPPTVQQFRDDVLGLLDLHDIERAHLVGQSMGGFTALRTALDAPDRVASLTMSATSGGIINPKPTDAVKILTRSGDRNVGGVKDTMSNATKANAPLMQLYESINNFNVNFAWSKLSNLLGPDGVIALETLNNVSAPTLFIAGAEDPLFPADLLASYVPHFQQANIEVVADAGHSPYFEQPQLFNQLLEQHIQGANHG